MPRHVIIKGFNSTQIRTFTHQYFKSIGKLDSADKFLSDTLLVNSKIKDLASCQLLCMLLCVLFDDAYGNLPDKMTDIYSTLFTCMIKRNLVKNNNFLGDIPDSYKLMLIEFGEIALRTCKENRVYFLPNEIKASQLSDILDIGFLTKCWSTSKINKSEYYQPLQKTFSEYLAALYLSTLIDQPALLRKELEVLVDNMHCCGAIREKTPELFEVSYERKTGLTMILRFIVGWLSDRSDLVFETLSPLQLEKRPLFQLMTEAGLHSVNVGECHTLPIPSLVAREHSLGINVLYINLQVFIQC